MKISRWVYVSCVLLVLALMCPSVLPAADSCCGSTKNRLNCPTTNRSDGPLKNLLDRASIKLTSNGFELLHTYYGQISDRVLNVVTVPLTGGREYGLVAVCDSCSGLDLLLYDEDDNLISSGVKRGNYTVFKARPTRTGQHKLVLRMGTCSQETCDYEIGLLGVAGCCY